MSQSYSIKTVQIAVTLGKGAFSEGGNTKVIEGLACDVSVLKPGLPEKNSASVKIWGLKYEDMAQLTMLAFRPLESLYNSLSIRAGVKGNALSVVFQGEIISAFADFNQQPDPCMQIEADSGSYPQQLAVPVATVKGAVEADKLFAQFAAEAGYSYANRGVSASVQNAWLPGSPIDKMTKLARDIGCELIIDDGEVLVMPAGAARAGTAVFLSESSGLIGYPTFNQDGIACRCHYNPHIAYGGLIDVRSMVPRASGIWRVTKINHLLSAYRPGGNWETQVEAVYND